MKKISVFFAAVMLAALFYTTTNCSPQTITTPIEESIKTDGTQLRNDFKEAIMEFEGTVDSLYIPEWLNE